MHSKRLELESVSAAELATRLEGWRAPRQRPEYATGVLARYAKLVGPASEGAVMA